MLHTDQKPDFPQSSNGRETYECKKISCTGMENRIFCWNSNKEIWTLHGLDWIKVGVNEPQEFFKKYKWEQRGKYYGFDTNIMIMGVLLFAISIGIGWVVIVFGKEKNN